MIVRAEGRNPWQPLCIHHERCHHIVKSKLEYLPTWYCQYENWRLGGGLWANTKWTQYNQGSNDNSYKQALFWFQLQSKFVSEYGLLNSVVLIQWNCWRGGGENISLSHLPPPPMSFTQWKQHVCQIIGWTLKDTYHRLCVAFFDSIYWTNHCLEFWGFSVTFVVFYIDVISPSWFKICQ